MFICIGGWFDVLGFDLIELPIFGFFRFWACEMKMMRMEMTPPCLLRFLLNEN